MFSTTPHSSEHIDVSHHGLRSVVVYGGVQIMHVQSAEEMLIILSDRCPFRSIHVFLESFRISDFRGLRSVGK